MDEVGVLVYLIRKIFRMKHPLRSKLGHTLKKELKEVGHWKDLTR